MRFSEWWEVRAVARFMTRSLGAPSIEVLEAVVEAAAEIGLDAPTQDRRSGELRLRGPLNRAGVGQRLAVSVTDNGLGGSTLHVSWDDRFPRRVTGHLMANRLCKCTRRLLFA
jgi:hypothetical protein